MKIARLLVRLVNSGMNVFITTHSDYLIKEFNNLLMLANDLPNKEAIMTECGYTQDDILHPEDLRAYITHLDGTVSQVDVDAYGMVQSGFDDAILQINETSNKLISAATLEEARLAAEARAEANARAELEQRLQELENLLKSRT
jgi:hypothetical protein